MQVAISIDRMVNSFDMIGVYFTASWCPPCQLYTKILKEYVARIQKRYGPSSFTILAIPCDMEQNTAPQPTPF